MAMIDPTTRENPDDFAVGYWRYREGKHWSECGPKVKTPAWLEGWYYGMTEGKRAVSFLQSKTIIAAFASGLAGMLVLVDPALLMEYPRLGGALVLTQAFLMAGLRTVTKGALK